MDRIIPRNFHRLALAVTDVGATTAWLDRVLGGTAVRGSESLMQPSPDRDLGNLAGTATQICWVGGYPVIALSGGAVGGFLARHGPGVQSWAWEIDDNWSAEHLLRRRGMDIISVNTEGRFFFMHPGQTHGLLWEWCDGKMPRDPELTTPRPGLVGVSSLAWITGLVADADATADWIDGLMEAKRIDGNPCGSADRERTIDLRIGDVVVRLVTPLTSASRYAADFDRRGPHVHSFALGVDDLDVALGALAAEGIGASKHADGLASTDPADTLGIRIDWTDRPARDV